jgi:glycosyltransferase involved in cell wall biosynthesis
MRILVWGTYDLGKPRNRIMLAGLRARGIEVSECHTPVWDAVEDKSTLERGERLRRWLRLLAAYPGLIIRFWRARRADLVLVGYLGHFDVLVLWLFARLRRMPIAWDAYLSLYNTVVEDRGLYRRRHPFVWLLHLTEWLAARAADRVLLDTNAHCEYFAHRFGIERWRVETVRLGVETDSFYPQASPAADAAGQREGAVRVLFYGQLAPVHGVDVILQAAAECRDADVHWHLVGDGQLVRELRRTLAQQNLPKLTWTPWVPYAELVQLIHWADVCLGVFGSGPKTRMVVPNKVLQALAAGRPVITADTPAVREQCWPAGALTLIPPGDPAALARAVLDWRKRTLAPSALAIAQACAAACAPAAIGAELETRLQQLLEAEARPSGTPLHSSAMPAIGNNGAAATVLGPLRELARPPLRLAHWSHVRLTLARARVFPRRGPYLLRHFAGNDPCATSNRAAIFAHYDPAGAVHDYHLEALTALRAAGCRVMLVTNAEQFGAAAAAQVASLVHDVLVRRNRGYDFGAWRDGLRALGDLHRYDQLILCNDSVYGPFCPLEPLLAKAESDQADVWSMTDGRNHGPHLQSYFLLFHRRAMTSAAFARFWARLPYVDDKFAVVEAGELTLSRQLLAAGLRLRALFPYDAAEACFRAAADPLRPTHQAMLRALDRGRAMNPTHHFWRLLIAEFGLPFIKRELLTLNPARLDDISDWEAVVQARFGVRPLAASSHLGNLVHPQATTSTNLIGLARRIMAAP